MFLLLLVFNFNFLFWRSQGRIAMPSKLEREDEDIASVFSARTENLTWSDPSDP